MEIQAAERVVEDADAVAREAELDAFLVILFMQIDRIPRADTPARNVVVTPGRDDGQRSQIGLPLDSGIEAV